MRCTNPLTLFSRFLLFFILKCLGLSLFTDGTKWSRRIGTVPIGILCLILYLLLSLLSPSSLHASTLQVGSKPQGVAVNPATSKAIVANKKDNTISIIDLTTSTVTSTIPVGEQPVGAAINSQSNQAVVTNKKSDTVSIVDLTTNTVTNTIQVGKDPYGVSIDPQSNIAAVTNSKDDTVTILNLTNNTIISTISVGKDPKGIAINPDTNQAIIANHKDDTITIIDLTTNTVINIIQVGKEPKNVAISLVTNEEDDTITTIILPDTVPPNIQITSPTDSQHLNTPIITITGTATDIYGTVTTVTVNNVTAVLTNDTFQADIQLTEGLNTITVIATDSSGNTGQTSITATS